MTTLYEGAFAKLNLTLDVLGKRPDGYHDIKSVMQAISLRDDIEIDIGTGKPWKLLCDKEGIPTDERNLAWKAAKVYCDTMKVDPDGLEIRITKRIPSEAGMGGGSADAAAVLRARSRFLFVSSVFSFWLSWLMRLRKSSRKSSLTRLISKANLSYQTCPDQIRAGFLYPLAHKNDTAFLRCHFYRILTSCCAS
jgi:hypothetical protein